MQSDKCLKPNEGIPSSLVALLAVMAGVSVANLYYCQPLLNLIREDTSSRMNTIYMVTYFIGGSFGTFLAGTMWVKFGWYGTVFAGLSMVIASILFTLLRRR